VGDDRRSASIYQALAGALPMGTFETDFGPTGAVRRWSPELIELMGFSGTQTPTDAEIRELVHPDDREAVAQVRAPTGQGHRPFEQEYRVIRPSDGKVRWIRVVARVSPDSTGKSGTADGVMIDVTAEREALSRLYANEELFRQVLESSSDGVLVRNLDGLIFYANRRLEQMFGFDPGEMVGKSVATLAPEGEESRARQALTERAAGESTLIEQEFTRRDGKSFFARVRGEPLRDPSGKITGGVGVFTDLSSELRARGAESLLASIVESSRDAIFARDLDGKILSFNRAAEELSGWKRSEIVGQHVFTLSADPERMAPLLSRQGAVTTSVEAKTRRKDGTLVDVQMSLFPLVDARGQVIGGGGVVRDLTERKEQERRIAKMQEQLHAAQKLEAIGSLAGGIAHDFNNILSVILSCSALASQHVSKGSPIARDLKEIEQAAERAATLVRQLLAFGRRQLLRPKLVDLGHQLTELVPMLKRLLGEQIELSLLAGRECAKVMADPAQLEQVVLNLCVNARDAMPMGGKLTLELSQVRLDEFFCSTHEGSTAGEHLMLAVTDTGTGMSKEVQARVFEPFFSTKGELGTGLGMSTVFGIVRQSGGTIWVYSEPNKGTTFKVYLPVAKENELATGKPEVQSRAAGGNETVLLVEDEDSVRSLMRNLLRGAGYTVLEAAGPGDALLVSEQFPAHVHLLLTDVVMPRMNGRQLAERLVVQRPQMKVLYTSGYTDDAIVQHGVLDGGLQYLEKPITPEKLLAKVRSVLDA
jgi:PAS domain S-box-containing protein